MSLLRNISSRTQLCCKKLMFSTIIKNYSGSTKAFSLKVPPVEKVNCEQEPEKTFSEIYRFSYIRLGYAINTFKWPQTLVVGFVFPNSVATYFGGIIDFDVLLAILFSGTVITSNVYGYGSCFVRAVGFMYLSEDDSTLKISYLDFWGARVDKEFSVDDIVPFTDCPPTPIDKFYRRINFYSTDKLKLKLYMKPGGQITNVDKFVKVFGDYTKY